jgi:hypothetical protein
MLKKIAFAGCATALLFGAIPAQAGLYTNGRSIQGLSVNGLYTNGLYTNGLYTNGLFANGLFANGISVNGVPTGPTDAGMSAGLQVIAVELPTAAN